MAALKPRTTSGPLEVRWEGRACTVWIPVGDDQERLAFALSGDEAQEIAALLAAVTEPGE